MDSARVGGRVRNRLGSRAGKEPQHGSPERGADLGKKPGTAEIMARPIVTTLATKFHIFLPSPWPVVDAISFHVPKGSGSDASHP